MPNFLNVPITPPRVAFIDPRSGNISREWYLFFLSLFQSQGGSSISLDDVQKGPPALTLDEIKSVCCNDENTQPSNVSIDQVTELQKQAEGLAEQPFNLVDQIAELRKQIEATQLTPPPREFKRSRYGQFYDTTTQTAAAINTPYAITFNTSDVSNGVYLGTPSSRIYVDTDGVYNVIFSIQLDKTSGGVGLFWVWPRVNGVDLPNSNSQVRIQGNDAETLVTVGYFLELVAGDYFEVMFAVDDVSVEVTAFPASAFYPSIPSIILTVTDNIQGVQ